jgi:hypothetical protein
VRRYAAEQAYTMLLTLEPSDGGEEDLEAAMELMGDTAWDGPIDAARAARAQLFACLGLPEPAPPTAAQAADAAHQARPDAGAADMNASYQALLTHTMRGL